MKTSSNGAALVVEESLRPGASPMLARARTFAGGVGVTVSATGKVRAGPGAVIRIRCLTAGTITGLYDNPVAASGTLILDSVAMTAGQVINLSEPLSFGLWAVVASGTFRVVLNPPI